MIDIHSVDDRHVRRRRLPRRHRQARQRRVVGAVRARRAGVRRSDGQRPIPDLRRGVRRQPGVPLAVLRPSAVPLDARLPLPGAGDTVRHPAAPTNRLRDFFADDDWFTDADSNAHSSPSSSAITTSAASDGRSSRPTPARPTPSCSPAPGSPRSSLLHAAACRSSTTATSRASPATAATRTPARTCSTRRSTVPRRRPDRYRRGHGRRPLRPDPPAVPGDQRARPRVRPTTSPCARAPSCTATASDGPGIYAFSRIDLDGARTSTSSPSTTARPPSAATFRTDYAGHDVHPAARRRGADHVRRRRHDHRRPCPRSAPPSTRAAHAARQRHRRPASPSPATDVIDFELDGRDAARCRSCRGRRRPAATYAEVTFAAAVDGGA